MNGLVREYTDPFLWQYTPVPLAGPGICGVCHGAPRTGWEICWSCDHTMGQVSRPVSLVVPISLYEHGSQYHRVLRLYKDGDGGASQERFKLQVASTLARFVAGHGPCISAVAARGWDTVTTVPSSRDRQGEHQLVEAVNRIRRLRDQYRTLLRPGAVKVKWNRADDQGYEPTQDVKRLNVLLIEDTFTSGAHVQSAASALQRAGARVVAVVVLGRIIDVNFSDETRALWASVKKRTFSFDECCLREAAPA